MYISEAIVSCEFWLSGSKIILLSDLSSEGTEVDEWKMFTMALAFIATIN